MRIPSGVSYVMENRRAMAQVLPEVFAATRILPVESYPGMLLRALRAAAPIGVERPDRRGAHPGRATTPPTSSTRCSPGRWASSWSRAATWSASATTWRCGPPPGEQRVDVIYRRIDDEFLDPVHFRADSVIGVAGLLNAARAGRVTIANAVGNGVADDKLLYTYVPDLIRYYLNEEPLLPNVETYRLDEPGRARARAAPGWTSWCSSRSTAPAARAS